MMAHQRRDEDGIISLEVILMRATITIPDERLEELMALTGAATRTAAINVAIDSYVRQAKLGRLLALEGSVDILSNDEIEGLDASERRGPWNAVERSFPCFRRSRITPRMAGGTRDRYRPRRTGGFRGGAA